MLLKISIILSVIVTSGISLGATFLPSNLSSKDQTRTLEILGFGSNSKILGNPYPLGGYYGVEVGITSEFVPVSDLATLGSGTTKKGEFNFRTLTFGKGLFHNMDTHIFFTPLSQEGNFQSYGLQFRWGFYELQYFPISFSWILAGGGANYSSLLNVVNASSDIVAAVNVDNVAVYFGGGVARALGRFIGGSNGITADQQTTEKNIVESHVVFGINMNLDKIFLALEVDRYVDSVYSGKIGYRF